MRLSKGDIGNILHDFCAGLGTKCDLDAPSHRKAYDAAVAALAGKAAPPDKQVSSTIKINPRRPLYDDKPEGYLESDRDFVENNLELCVQILSALEMAELLGAVLKARR